MQLYIGNVNTELCIKFGQEKSRHLAFDVKLQTRADNSSAVKLILDSYFCFSFLVSYPKRPCVKLSITMLFDPANDTN